MSWWLDLMRESAGIDGSRKPFFANVADFPFYVNPPGNPVAGFGDFSETPLSISSMADTVATFAGMRQNSAWQWFAEQATGSDPEGSGPLGFLRSLQADPPAKKPTGLPLLKLFHKTGIAAFHTDLTNARDNMHMAVRASQYGNVSHSHNDQNAIVMAAFGEPLLVNTGRRDFYGSPFCKAYYWDTRSHNGLLINGHGQTRGQAATAKIVAHGETADRIAWAVGDATPAYGGRAELYRRWTVFLPGYGAVLIDEIKTTATDVSLLFHGRAPFDVKNTAAGQQFSLVNGGVRLQGFVAANAAQTTQTDHYPVPLHTGIKPLFDEWHLTVKVPVAGAKHTRGTLVLDGVHYVVTFLRVSRVGEEGFLSKSADAAGEKQDYFVSGIGRHLRIRDGRPGSGGVQLRVDLDAMTVVRE